MADGFNVNLEGIDKYAGELSGDKALVSEVQGLVSQSDVGDESLGIVGLFVKSTYSGMLGELNGLLGDMSEGLQGGADKMTETAADYRAVEDAIAEIFNEGAAALGGN